MAHEKTNDEKVKVVCTDSITAGFLDKELSGVTASWKMKLTETKDSVFRGKIENLESKLSFDGVTVRELVEFACKGQSCRVALQGWLRRQSHQWVKGEGVIRQDLRFLLDRKSSGGGFDPIKSVVKKAKSGEMTKEETAKLIAELQATMNK